MSGRTIVYGTEESTSGCTPICSWWSALGVVWPFYPTGDPSDIAH